MGLFKMIWSSLVSLGALVVWPVAKLKGMKNIRPVIRWGLHFLCVAATVGLLWYINNAWELDKALRVPVAMLRTAWLPLLFVLTYLTAWCGWWLWRLMMSEDRPSEYPDIDAAWREATDQLAQSGVDLTRKPLFLVLGQPAETEAAFFSATQLPFTHPQLPRDPDAPLHLHVAEEGVFVTCAGASLLGAQSALLAEDRTWRKQEPLVNHGRSHSRDQRSSAVDYAELPPIHEGFDAPSGGPSTGRGAKRASAATATLSESTGTAVLESPTGTMGQLAQGLGLVEDGIALLAEEVSEAAAPVPTEEEAFSPALERQAVEHEIPLVKDLQEIENIRARLDHLCRLISQTREPYCPLNGVAVLIPYAAGESDRLANQIAALAQRDLETVQAAMQVRCPLVAVVCDLQEAPGCRELIQMFPEEQRHRRLGVKFPLLCEDPAASVTQLVDQGIGWVCRSLIPPLVFRLFQSNETRTGQSRGPVRTNARLYQFLDDIRKGEPRFARIMRQSFASGEPRGWLPAGCYFVASGTDLQRDQGFAGGVLSQLHQMQNLLAWLPGARQQDRLRRLWTLAGYTCLALVALSLVAAFVWVF